MPKILSSLNESITDEKKCALFLLSNIAGSSDKDLVDELLKEDAIIDRVIQLSNNDNIVLKGEATWVLTNAI